MKKQHETIYFTLVLFRESPLRLGDLFANRKLRFSFSNLSQTSVRALAHLHEKMATVATRP